MKTIKHLPPPLVLVLFFALVACVTEFRPDVKAVRGILVVDGMITTGESRFTLSRSVGINDTLLGNEGVTNAEVWVERDDGPTFPARHEGGGRYLALTGELDPARAYRLAFRVDGETYHSSFLQPIQTAPIDSVSFTKAERGAPVRLHVSTHAEPDAPRFYRWSYRETWEFHAPRLANYGYIDGVGTRFNLNSSRNTYYCWGRDSSKILLLGSTADLSENRVSQHVLAEIPCDDDKMMTLYHVEVTQTQIREEAYDYFRFLQDEIERTAGLFSPILSAGDNGNIFNDTRPDEPIIGFIEVATSTTLSRYLDNAESRFHEDPYMPCMVGVAKDTTGFHYWYNIDEKIYVVEGACVDCREHYNASKDKPEWWPTDHW